MKLIGIKKAIIALVMLCMSIVGGIATSPGANAATRSCSSSTPVAQRPTVRYGDTGSCVRELQLRLNKHGYGLATDGIFGPKTLSATKRYQTSVHIVSDGIVGPITWGKLLGKVVTPPRSSSYNKYGCGNAGNKVLLVFDDYPMSSTAFKSLISTAKKYNIGIGVAPNGMYVRSGRAPVSYARQNGMLVVDHTYDHRDLTTLSYSGVVWEITRPYVRSNYVRPPYGAENSTVRSALANYRKYDCLWNLDPRDWDGRSPRSAADYIIRNARPGSTAVVHMNHLGTQPSLLPYIKSGLARRGIKMCTPWSKPTTNTMPAVYCS